MADFTADFENGSNGSTITSGGGGSATPWNAVDGTDGVDCTRIYDDTHVAHGSLAAKLERLTQSPRMIWFHSASEHWGRFYLYGTGNPSAQVTVIFTQCLSPSTGVWALSVRTDGKLRMEDTGGTHSVTSTNTVSWNQWVRIEFHVIHSDTVGFGEVKLFNDAASTTPTETLTAPSANWDTGSLSGENRVAFAQDGNWGAAIWFDDIVANATAYPGPVASPPQTLLVSADSVDGAWTDQAGGTSLAAAIDEATFDDADYIRSELNPSASGCRLKLSPGGDPHISDGHVINWRTGKIGSATINMTVKLYQGGGNSQGGGTLIASFDRNNVGALTSYTETLSGGEADSITDYTDLYLEFFADTA